MIDYSSFRGIFGSSFWQAIKNSLVPFEVDQMPSDKEEFLRHLYEDICTKRYTPSLPREYIVYNKHNFVSRIVPTFSYRDYCVYFFCIKMLEDEIAVNRVDGTFGGWRLGNPLRNMEDDERINLTEEIVKFNLIEEIPEDVSVPKNSYNSFAWGKNWQEFQKLAHDYGLEEDFKYIIKFDIANFYDSINLNLLENKIRLVVSQEKRSIIDLLCTFLGYWNRRFEGYNRKTVGLPQDELGDCSRILANFYLQNYDKSMSDLCKEVGANYLRYADDQIIYSSSDREGKRLLFSASKELAKINLNLNSGKVIEFKSKENFSDYWAFDLFNLLEDPHDKQAVNKACKLFIEMENKNVIFRSPSVLKRLLKIDFSLLESDVSFYLLAKVYNKDFLANSDCWYLKKIHKNSENPEELFKILDDLVDVVNYNSFHFSLLKFYKAVRPEHDSTIINEKIKKLRFM